jgi:hypothetical protein
MDRPRSMTGHTVEPRVEHAYRGPARHTCRHRSRKPWANRRRHSVMPQPDVRRIPSNLFEYRRIPLCRTKPNTDNDPSRRPVPAASTTRRGPPRPAMLWHSGQVRGHGTADRHGTSRTAKGGCSSSVRGGWILVVAITEDRPAQGRRTGAPRPRVRCHEPLPRPDRGYGPCGRSRNGVTGRCG